MNQLTWVNTLMSSVANSIATGWYGSTVYLQRSTLCESMHFDSEKWQHRCKCAITKRVSRLGGHTAGQVDRAMYFINLYGNLAVPRYELVTVLMQFEH
eukprot:SAG11_NODE_8531_length_1005_cov_1.112583_1_plen_98_part_00